VLTAGSLRGQVNDTSWTSALLAYRTPVTNTNPMVGSYTLLFSPLVTTLDHPPGSGIATTTVSAKAIIKMTGSLAEGTAVSHSATLSENGYWPLLVRLYRGQGLLIGWLQLPRDSEVITDSLPRWLCWIKPPSPQDRRYPAGFNTVLSAQLAKYTRPAAKQNAMEWAHGYLIAGGGDLTDSVTNQVVATNGLLLVTQAMLPQLKTTVAPATGLINGTFRHPGTGASTTFKAVLIQQPPASSDIATDSFAGGWFLGSRQGGSIRLVPVPPPNPD
jgi:hypothetical protein